MKTVLLMMVSLFASSVSFASVDFSQANPVLRSISDAIVSSDDMVEYALPQFDTNYSDLEMERLKYDLSGKANFPWGKGEASGSTIWASKRDGMTGISVRTNVTVKTDVLAFARYAGQLALKKSGNYGPVFADRITVALNKLSNVRTMDELYAEILDGQQLAQEIVKAKLADSTEGSERQDWNAVLAGYQGTHVQATRSGAKVESISVDNPESDGLVARWQHQGHAQGMALQLTTGAIQAELDVFVYKTGAQLDRLKSDFDRIVNGAIQGQASDRATIDGDYRQALIDFKRVVRGENHY